MSLQAASNPLFAVRDTLRARGLASVAQIAAERQLPVAVVDEILAHWVRRGMAHAVAPQTGGACGSGGCSSCGQCAVPSHSAMLYAWDGPGAAAAPQRPVIALKPAA